MNRGRGRCDVLRLLSLFRRFARLMPAMAAFGATHVAPGGGKLGRVDRITRIARGTGKNHARPVEIFAKIGVGGPDRKRRGNIALIQRSRVGSSPIFPKK